MKTYEDLKQDNNLKEFIFLTRSGYRHFFVLGKDLNEAENNFMKIDEFKRYGFSLKDLPIRLEYKENITKNWSMDDYWENNENKTI